ncbi:hypothetical protein CN238_17480 [Sinorhizobium meliloti]|nr:hypothetical protein CN238_17480 [Sinorhizobium meliloti]RVH27211.1 hypothetical protein CN214_20400 [Sinorhizobium meliloti]
MSGGSKSLTSPNLIPVLVTGIQPPQVLGLKELFPRRRRGAAGSHDRHRDEGERRDGCSPSIRRYYPQAAPQLKYARTPASGHCRNAYLLPTSFLCPSQKSSQTKSLG